TSLPFGGHSIGKLAITLICGAVSSIMNNGDRKSWRFPARSVAVTTPATAFPSMESTSGLADGIVACTPAPASLALNGIDTSVLFQPFAFGDGRGIPKVTIGGVPSTTRTRLPAASVT